MYKTFNQNALLKNLLNSAKQLVYQFSNSDDALEHLLKFFLHVFDKQSIKAIFSTSVVLCSPHKCFPFFKAM